jgi:hypothetical protein
MRLCAGDFGLVLELDPGYESADGVENLGGDQFRFSGMLKPWFSTPLGETTKLYVSAGASFTRENGEYTLVPEIYRSELSWRPGTTRVLQAGRVYYEDPLGFIAEGLFDGVSWESAMGGGVFSAGAYYTGLLYKKTANITVTGDELSLYRSELDYGDFVETYFAPRRGMAAAGYSVLLAETVRLKLALLGQFDLRDTDSKYHSQYLVVKMAVPLKAFVLEAGAAGELAEATEEDPLFGLAGELRFSWMLPTPIRDRLAVAGRYASGRQEGSSSFAEFRPLTTEAQGKVLRAKLSGLSVIEMIYAARLHSELALELTASYFIQNDLAYQGYFASSTDYFLGGEAYGELIWNPASDLEFNLGGGIFLPSLGNTSPEAKPLWLVSFSIIMALL